MRFRLWQLMLLGALAGVACEDSTAPTGGSLRTDANAYTATAVGSGGFEVRLIVAYWNDADTVAKLDRCLPTDGSTMYSVQLISPMSAEGAAYDGPWACEGEVTPLEVNAGATRT